MWYQGRPSPGRPFAFVESCDPGRTRGIVAAMNEKPPIPDLTPMIPIPPKEEGRFLARLAAHPSAGEEPGDSEEMKEFILDIGRARIAGAPPRSVANRRPSQLYLPTHRASSAANRGSADAVTSKVACRAAPPRTGLAWVQVRIPPDAAT